MSNQEKPADPSDKKNGSPSLMEDLFPLLTLLNRGFQELSDWTAGHINRNKSLDHTDQPTPPGGNRGGIRGDLRPQNTNPLPNPMGNSLRMLASASKPRVTTPVITLVSSQTPPLPSWWPKEDEQSNADFYNPTPNQSWLQKLFSGTSGLIYRFQNDVSEDPTNQAPGVPSTGPRGALPAPGNPATGIRGDLPAPGNPTTGIRGDLPAPGNPTTGIRGDLPAPGNPTTGIRGDLPVPGNPTTGIRGDLPAPGNPTTGIRGDLSVPGNPTTGIRGDLSVPGYPTTGLRGALEVPSAVMQASMAIDPAPQWDTITAPKPYLTPASFTTGGGAFIRNASSALQFGSSATTTSAQAQPENPIAQILTFHLPAINERLQLIHGELTRKGISGGLPVSVVSMVGGGGSGGSGGLPGSYAFGKRNARIMADLAAAGGAAKEGMDQWLDETAATLANAGKFEEAANRVAEREGLADEEKDTFLADIKTLANGEREQYGSILATYSHARQSLGMDHDQAMTLTKSITDGAIAASMDPGDFAVYALDFARELNVRNDQILPLIQTLVAGDARSTWRAEALATSAMQLDVQRAASGLGIQGLMGVQGLLALQHTGAKVSGTSDQAAIDLAYVLQSMQSQPQVQDLNGSRFAVSEIFTDAINNQQNPLTALTERIEQATGVTSLDGLASAYAEANNVSKEGAMVEVLKQLGVTLSADGRTNTYLGKMLAHPADYNAAGTLLAEDEEVVAPLVEQRRGELTRTQTEHANAQDNQDISKGLGIADWATPVYDWVTSGVTWLTEKINDHPSIAKAMSGMDLALSLSGSIMPGLDGFGRLGGMKKGGAGRIGGTLLRGAGAVLKNPWVLGGAALATALGVLIYNSGDTEPPDPFQREIARKGKERAFRDLARRIGPEAAAAEFRKRGIDIPSGVLTPGSTTPGSTTPGASPSPSAAPSTTEDGATSDDGYDFQGASLSQPPGTGASPLLTNAAYGQSGAEITINAPVTIHAAQGMDEVHIAALVEEKLMLCARQLAREIDRVRQFDNRAVMA